MMYDWCHELQMNLLIVPLYSSFWFIHIQQLYVWLCLSIYLPANLLKPISLSAIAQIALNLQ